MEEVTIQTIIAFVTMVVTYIFGRLAKKFNWIESKYIPYQNVTIGLLAGVLAYIIGLVEDPAIGIISCVTAALGAGGGYDLVKKSKE